MKIYQAIKYKKMLQSEISDLWKKIGANNSIIKGNKRDYSSKDLIDKVKEKSNELTKLKVALQKVNKPIYDKIFSLAELKSFISYLKTINSYEGILQEKSFGQPASIVEYESEINTKEIDDIIEATQKDISKLQDDLDQYNYKTNIKW